MINVSDMEAIRYGPGFDPIDWKVRAGALRARLDLTFPDVLGRDLSGVIVAIGANVTDLKTGDAVFGVCPPNRWGSHAELVAVDAKIVAVKPHEVSHVEAASIALVGITALTALEKTATVEPGMKVLIHAGAGGVGAFAIQYCKSRGATVYLYRFAFVIRHPGALRANSRRPILQGKTGQSAADISPARPLKCRVILQLRRTCQWACPVNP